MTKDTEQDSQTQELVIQILVGTPEDIRAGRGQTVVNTAEVAFRLGISGTRVGQLVKDGALQPCAHLGTLALFFEVDIEELRRHRARR